MAADSLDRLKSQLLTSGLQQENFALYQVINQLIDYVRGNTITTQSTISGGGGGGGVGLLGATYLTKNKEVGLPNSLQEIAGAGIQFNDANGRRVVSVALPFNMDSGGEGGEDGPPGPPGSDGVIGPQGIPGTPGRDGIQFIPLDGENGIDGDPGQPGATGGMGPPGSLGPPGIPGIDGLEGEIGEQGIMGGTGPIGPPGPEGSGAGRIFYPDPSDPSDIATYFTALDYPSPNAETTLGLALTGTGDTFLGAFATNPGVPNVDSLPAGTAFRHFHVTTGADVQVARLKVDFYKCASDGSGETLLRSGYSPNFFGTTIQEIIWTYTDGNSYSFLLTDRIILKLYLARVSGPATVNATVYFDGNNNASFIQSTISIGLTGPIGPQGPPGIGIQGFDGEDGFEGPPGIQGPMGPQGPAGPSGSGGGGGTSMPLYIEPEEPEHQLLYPYIVPSAAPAGSGLTQAEVLNRQSWSAL
jgi:hypothetical protein